MFIRRSENSPFTTQNSPLAYMTIFHSDVEPFSKYSPVMLHLSPAAGVFNENPDLRKETAAILH